MNSVTKRVKPSFTPIVRFRSVGLWVALVAALVACPLFAVWKQVYIRDMSIRKQVLVDSLVLCNREVAQMKMVSEKYSATPRIEYVARERLGLEYPTADRIVLVRPREKDDTAAISAMAGSEFLSVLRRSMGQGGS